MDALHLEFPFAGSKMLRDLLAEEGIAVGRLHVATLMKRMGIAGVSLSEVARRCASPEKLTADQKAAFAKRVADGPIPAVDGVVRWRACDLQQWISEEFGVSESDETVYRMRKVLGFAHVSGRPKAYRRNEEAVAAFKKTSARRWQRSAPSSARTHRSRSGSRACPRA